MLCVLKSVFKHFLGLASLSKQLGHSSVHVTSKYCHAKEGESASSFIDLSTDDVAEAELTVEHHYKLQDEEIDKK